MDLTSKLQSNNPIFDNYLSCLPTNLTHRDMLTKYEKIPTYIYSESIEASIVVAAEIAELIREKQRKGQNFVIGLSTGSTQIRIYAELVRHHKEEGLSFKNVITFSLDEYYPMSSHSLKSYHQYIKTHLLNHIDILPQNIHIPDGTIILETVHDYCRDYEKKIADVGGIDMMLLGIGRTGHIGFNEPGSGRNTRTRIITLDPVTRQEDANQFQGFGNVPRRAITMGIDTILNGNTREIAGGDPFRVITGDFVTTEDGTGIVHTAPAFGADDYKVGKKHDIGILIMVDRQGKFTDYMGDLSGRYVKNYKDDPDYKDVDVEIAVGLKLKGQAFKIEKYEHNYPHCWRTDKPIIYYPLDAWFIRTTAVKDRMVELNKTINWKPKATGEGRFGNWLSNLVDWNLSRSRYWGTPLPVWATEDGSELKCIGSIAELMSEAHKANKVLGINQLLEGSLDLHKPYVDQIILVSDSGLPMQREPDLIDVWFDSGAMPYAQMHYPFENKNLFPEPVTSSSPLTNNIKHYGGAFPADFIAEGVDQTRGWFYTLHALGVMLFDSVAYKTVVSNGLVLDKNGNKMSKRHGNVIDPFLTIEKYSADATRWYLITNASPWDSLKFDLEGIKEVQRKYFGTLYNTYQFFALYANVDNFSFEESYIPVIERPEIDRWILSSLHTLIKNVTLQMEDYEPTAAGRAIEVFLDEQLSNWYVRLCRRRFWKGEYEHDKICAYQTLYECLETITLLMAPIAPFFADWMFQNLNGVTKRDTQTSVHLANYPEADESFIDEELEERMQLAQGISSLVLSIRKKVNIKVRQPLQKILIPVMDVHTRTQIEKIEDLIKSEVNIKDIEYLTETEGFIKKKLKPNFKTLGARMGAKMKSVAAAINQLNQAQISILEKDKAFGLQIGEEIIEISIEDVEIIAEDIPGWSVANKDNLTVALDITISPVLLEEGNARELVNRIQNIRKDNDYKVTDRIIVEIEEHQSINDSVRNYNDYICKEILADIISLVPSLSEGTDIEVNDETLKIFIKKTS